MNEHALKQYDQELSHLSNQVMEMGGLVERQIGLAVQALMKGDSDEIDEIISNDHKVNRMEVAIDNDLAHIIARRQPTAFDLRLILAISKTVANLERIGDEAAKIARYAGNIHTRGRVLPLPDIERIGKTAQAAVQKALDVFARQDALLAQEIIDDDKIIDENFSGIIRQLITFVMEDQRTVGTTIDYVLLAKAIERIGDHAKNIAEQVIYIVHGADVRHIDSTKES